MELIIYCIIVGQHIMRQEGKLGGIRVGEKMCFQSVIAGKAQRYRDGAAWERVCIPLVRRSHGGKDWRGET